MSFIERTAQQHLDFLHLADKLTPTDEDFVSWVDSHAIALRPVLYMAGPERCWLAGKASYKAWVLERRNISITDYMADILSESEYLRWVEMFATNTLAPDSPSYNADELPA